MIVSDRQLRRAENEEDVDESRKRAAIRSKLWPNGVVHYMIDSSLSKYLNYALQLRVKQVAN